MNAIPHKVYSMARQLANDKKTHLLTVYRDGRVYRAMFSNGESIKLCEAQRPVKETYN